MILPAMVRAVDWFRRHLGVHGLLVNVPHWHFIEWADLGREGESAPINALMVGALNAVAGLCLVVGWEGNARAMHAMADKAAITLNARHWDEKRGVYVDVVDPQTGAQGRRVSQHANALALLFGIATKERIGRIAAAITDRSRIKITAAPPIVTESEPFDEDTDVVGANTFYSHFVYAALARVGQFGWVINDIRSRYGPMLATGTTTLWESFTPNASLCHAFSATPVYQLSRQVLGIVPIAPRYARFAVEPSSEDLTWARGVVPTAEGLIHVEWRATDGTIWLGVRHPRNCKPVLSEQMLARTLLRSDIEDGFELTLKR